MEFIKYQATGNDFILIDNRSGNFEKGNHQIIRTLCNRRFGIGADGLMLLESDSEKDFRMVYFNADGFEGSMCGNGGRCISAYAFELLGLEREMMFSAFDGPHRAKILSHQGNSYAVRLEMKEVHKPQPFDNDWILDTGSPHYIRFVEQLELISVPELGRQIRNSAEFKTRGINVNFVQHLDSDSIAVRTYERGVEDETLSCGTGVTAAAIAAFDSGLVHSSQVKVQTPGGNLNVEFRARKDSYTNVFLEGEVVKVFSGTYFL